MKTKIEWWHIGLGVLAVGTGAYLLWPKDEATITVTPQGLQGPTGLPPRAAGLFEALGVDRGTGVEQGATVPTSVVDKQRIKERMHMIERGQEALNTIADLRQRLTQLQRAQSDVFTREIQGGLKLESSLGGVGSILSGEV